MSYSWPVVASLSMLLAGACASTGDGSGGQGDDESMADARPGFPDASAPVLFDAAVADGLVVTEPDASPPDASPPDADLGFFCTFNEQCPESQCCLAVEGAGLCVDGVRIDTFCFPAAATL